MDDILHTRTMCPAPKNKHVAPTPTPRSGPFPSEREWAENHTHQESRAARRQELLAETPAPDHQIIGSPPEAREDTDDPWVINLRRHTQRPTRY